MGASQLEVLSRVHRPLPGGRDILVQPGWLFDTLHDVKIAAFQFSPEPFASGPDSAARNIHKVCSAAARAGDSGAALLVLPELWATSFAFGDPEAALRENSRALDAIAAASAKAGLVITGSLLTKGAGHAPRNTAHVVDRGRVVAMYHKTHLFTPTKEEIVFESGDEGPVVVETTAGRMGVVICYDIRFPELCRSLFLQEVEILAVPAQWAAERTLQFRALTAGRAVENQCVVVGVNRTGSETTAPGNTIQFPGGSLVATAFGEIASEAGPDEMLLFANVDLERQRALRRLIPCARDRRPDLYTQMGKGGTLAK